MKQMVFLNNGKMTDENITTACVGMSFYKDAPRVKKGQFVDVKPIDVKGYKNVLGVFVHDVQIGNIISTLTNDDIASSVIGGFDILTNHQLAKDVDSLTFKVKSVGVTRIVLNGTF